MLTLINEIVKQLLVIIKGGFLSSVESSEIWLFSSIDHLLLGGTSTALSQEWFYQFFQRMELLSLALVLPVLLIGLCSAVVTGSGGYLVRLILFYLPISLVGSGIFLVMFEGLSTVVDAMSKWIIDSQNLSLDSLTNMVSGLSARGNIGNPMPFILIAIAGIGSVVAALSLYFELLIREGVMLVLAAFIPFVLLGMLLTSSRAIVHRFIEVSIGVIFSKLAVVVFLSLGIQMALHSGSIGRSSQFLIALAIVILASFSPFLLLALLPAGYFGHQAQISQYSREKTKRISRLGSLLVGPSAVGVDYEALPTAQATQVPSYLRQSGDNRG